jgi:hypothetical protein
MSKNRRALTAIATDLEQACRDRTTNMLHIGALLIEAKEQLDRGGWLPWLADNFSASEDTAERYMSTARLVTKFRKLRNLKLTKGAFYTLAGNEEILSDRMVEAVVAAAKLKAPRWLDDDETTEICEHIEEVERLEAIAKDEGKTVEQVSREEAEATAVAMAAIARRREAERAELEADLADETAPPPKPPESEPADVSARDTGALKTLDECVKRLNTITSRPPALFLRASPSSDDLDRAGRFLLDIAAARRRAAHAPDAPGAMTGQSVH